MFKKLIIVGNKLQTKVLNHLVLASLQKFSCLFLQDTSHIVRRKISQLDSSVVRGELVCEIDNTGRTINYTLTKKEEKKKKRINYKIMPYFYKSYSVTGKPGTLDVVSRFMFPFMYLCFNIFFWMIYSQEEKGDPDGGHHI